MTSNSHPQATVGLVLPWSRSTLDHTDRVAALIPDKLLDWRLPDPSGRWHFSLAEIVLHCADERKDFARMLSGREREEENWTAGPEGDGAWKFRPYSGKAEILESLHAGRLALQPWLDLPASSLLDTTDATRGTFEKAIAAMKKEGKDTTEAEARGPVNVVRALMGMACHEQGHRATLQTLLRMHGISLKE